jgi:hypothetical protein
LPASALCPRRVSDRMKGRAFILSAAGAIALRSTCGRAQNSNVPTVGVLVVADPSSERRANGSFRISLGPRAAWAAARIGAGVCAPQGRSDREMVHASGRGRRRQAGYTRYGARRRSRRYGDGRESVPSWKQRNWPIGRCSGAGREEHRVTFGSFCRRRAACPRSSTKPFLEQVQRAASATGTEIDPVMLHKIDDVDAAFAAIGKSRPDAVIVQPTLGLGAGPNWH